MREFLTTYTFEVEVDPSNYEEVHKYFMHQTVFIRYTFAEDGGPNKVKFQPEPMVREDARLVEKALKRIGAIFITKPITNKA